MIGFPAIRRALRLAVVGALRTLLGPRAVFRLVGVPVGTADLRRLPQIPVYESSSKAIPLPATVEEAHHPKFIPGSSLPYRPTGWFFERSFVVSVRDGIARSTGVSFTPTGHAIDLGPGLTAPPVAYERFYQPLSPTRHFDDAVVTLATFWDSNYFHWLFDVLPRLHLIERAGLKVRWIYAALRHSFQKQTLLQLGYSSDRIIDAAIVPHVSATDLIVPSLPGTPGVMPDWVCDFLRKRLTPGTAADNARLRVYVSRAGARNRRIINEPTLLPLLAGYGFTAVKLETMSFEEQARMFASAECVVAPHGAGLANLIFCNPGASVVEILPSKRTNLCYWLLSQQASLKYHYVVGKASGRANDLEVDLDKIKRSIDAAIGTRVVRGTLPLSV